MKKNADGYYRTTIVVGKTPDGKAERVVIRGKTKKECEEKIYQTKRLLARGVQLGEMLVYEWANKWMAVYKSNLTNAQYNHYRAKLNNDILPEIGGMRIKDVRRSHLQELLNRYEGQKEGTVTKIKIAIQQLFADAEEEGIIEKNPAAKLELPKMNAVTRRPLTEFERNIVMEVARKHLNGAYVMTMLFCGLRRGEALALKRMDVDLDKRILIINESISFAGNGDKPSNQGEKKPPKTQAGIRIVPIPNILFPYLEKVCIDLLPNEIIFKNQKGGYATLVTCRHWWRSFSRSCHIEAKAPIYRNKILFEQSPFDSTITPHYLRHTYATDLYAAGIDEKARKAFLGHSSQDITDIYTKMSERAFERARQLLEEYYIHLGLNDGSTICEYKI